jgi:hypothetical protein
VVFLYYLIVGSGRMALAEILAGPIKTALFLKKSKAWQAANSW